MKKLIGVLMLLALSCFSFESLADNSGLYVTGGGGAFTFSGIKMSKTERDILATPGVSGNWQEKNKSLFTEIGLGWRFSQYVSVEASYLDGANMYTTTRVTNVNAGTLKVGNTAINLGSYPTDIVLNREAKASAFKLAVNGEYPLTSWVSVIGTVGAYNWYVDVVNKVSVDRSGVYAGVNESLQGTSPMASAGFDFKLNDKTGTRLQWMHIKDATMLSLTLQRML